jgi:DNA modification methylase/ribosomal protein S27AE
MGLETLDSRLGPGVRREKGPISRVVQAKPHSPVYTMHKYWARRPHNVFYELISHYSEPGDIVLDPFCGGGVTVVESLRLRRKVVGVDLNPLATYITEMEVRPLSIEVFWSEFEKIKKRIGREISDLYRTSCPSCGDRAVFDWLEWAGDKPTRMKYVCQKCGTGIKMATEEDLEIARGIERSFERIVSERQLWYPRAEIPRGDKTSGIINDGYRYFWQLFTKRNLLALSLLYKEISAVNEREARDFLRLAFSSALKWASRMSHLRGSIVEGWAMHAYWVYPKALEINVWNTFHRRCIAVARGKSYSNKEIGDYYRRAESFKDLLNDKATCLILTQSSTELPIEDESVDVIITDPPYGGNVNYAELADYWMVWLNQNKVTDKTAEIIINRTQKKGLDEYELGLTQVFKECYRVLKKGGKLVATFNSRDLHVVASFVIAATQSGFHLHPQGLLYQPPIKAYTTTFHGIFVGAFVGDFIFTFYKPSLTVMNMASETGDLESFKRRIDELVKSHIDEKITEPELREKAYRALIPFLAEHAQRKTQECREAVEYFETQMRRLEPHFREVRRRVVEERRRLYSQKRGETRADGSG